ncbi:MAG: macro domain-containing protein [Trueperaceae bacterium]
MFAVRGVERTVASVRIEATPGRLVDQSDVDALVIEVGPHLERGTGPSGAVHGAAGPGLADEARPLGPIPAGRVVRTAGHALSARFVIHAVCPIFDRRDRNAQLLADAHRAALYEADAAGAASLALPALCIGPYGYPPKRAAAIAVSAVLDAAPTLSSLHCVRFVLHDDACLDAYASELRDAEA